MNFSHSVNMPEIRCNVNKNETTGSKNAQIASADVAHPVHNLYTARCQFSMLTPFRQS